MKIPFLIVLVGTIVLSTIGCHSKQALNCEEHFYNSLHPESHKNEVFLTNISSNFVVFGSGWIKFAPNALERNFDKISITTKRLGNIAYSATGCVIPGSRPVFVQQSNLDTIAK